MLRHERVKAPQRSSDRYLVDRPLVIVVVIGAVHAIVLQLEALFAKKSRKSAKKD
jgi:hypothetical protein